MSCCKIMNKAAIPSLVITNLMVLKTKITYIQTKNSMKMPVVSKRNKYYSFNKKKFTNIEISASVVAKEDPQARTVGGRVVHDGSQL